MTLESDRVRRHTAQAVLERIDDETTLCLAGVAGDAALTHERLQALEREWDVDRMVEAEAAGVGLLGLALGALADRRLLVVPLAVGAAVFLYATAGRYPWLPMMRRLGLRTSREISRERYALKALRGDFSHLAARAPARGPGAAVAEPAASNSPAPSPSWH